MEVLNLEQEWLKQLIILDLSQTLSFSLHQRVPRPAGVLSACIIAV